jgi:hypothetical protein
MSKPTDATNNPKNAQPFTKHTWEKVNEPGAYVCNDTGRLFRVPASAIDAQKRPLIELSGPQGSPMVTRLSPDPQSPITGLRSACSSTEIKPQF